MESSLSVYIYSLPVIRRLLLVSRSMAEHSVFIFILTVLIGGLKL